MLGFIFGTICLIGLIKVVRHGRGYGWAHGGGCGRGFGHGGPGHFRPCRPNNNGRLNRCLAHVWER